MSLLTRLALAVLLSGALLAQAQAADDTRPAQEQVLVAFTSDEGLTRLARAGAKVDFPALANQFEAQSNVTFCGPTTAAIVLNAARGASRDLPRDRRRLSAEDARYLPSGFDPSIPRFTQENVIDKGQKTRSQVLGEPVSINGKQVRDLGYQLRQLDELLRANGLATRLTIVDDSKSEAAIRIELVENLKRSGDYVVVNYRREAVGQRGGGHISPLGAYDAESDSFLVLDVNPAAAGWVWMPTATLVRGMRTFDTVENRGYILVDSSAPSREVAAVLAPTGKLRVGMYPGSPTSYIAGDSAGRARGVGYELGAKLAQRAQLPFEPLVFASNDKVLEALKDGKVDLVLTNATAERAQFIDFAPTVLVIDKGYLVASRSSLQDTAEIDRAGMRVGVSRGSSSEGELGRILRNASLVVVPSIDDAIRALSEERLDAFATNKAILFQMSDRLPGSRVLGGRWGGEAIAFGLPKGRAAALPYLSRFVEEERDSGGVRAAAERAGVRGLSAKDTP